MGWNSRVFVPPQIPVACYSREEHPGTGDQCRGRFTGTESLHCCEEERAPDDQHGGMLVRELLWKSLSSLAVFSIPCPLVNGGPWTIMVWLGVLGQKWAGNVGGWEAKTRDKGPTFQFVQGRKMGGTKWTRRSTHYTTCTYVSGTEQLPKSEQESASQQRQRQIWQAEREAEPGPKSQDQSMPFHG